MSGHDTGVWTDIGVVIVAYNSASMIGECLDALGPAGEIIVVDNASRDGTADAVRRHRPDAQIISNDSNAGYANACNQGMAAVTRPFGLTITPDAIVAPGVVEALAAEHAQHRAGVVAPVLFSDEGDMDLPVMGPTETTHRPMTERPDGAFCTWFVTGAVLLFRMDAWRDVGGFDPALFLYGDDSDMSLGLTRKGWPIVTRPDLAVTHKGGKSTPPTAKVRWIRDWHMTWSHFFLQGKYASADQAKADARTHARVHALKALKYVLLLNPKYVVGNVAKAHAAWSYAVGKPSH